MKPVRGVAALAVAVLMVTAWGAFFAVGLDEECGRLNDCELSLDALYATAWLSTAAALACAVVWLRHRVGRARR